MKPQTKKAAIFKSLGYAGLFYGAQLIPQFAVMFFAAFRLAAGSDRIPKATELMNAANDAALKNVYLLMCVSFLLFFTAVGVICLIRKRSFAEKTGLTRTRPLDAFAGLTAGFGAFLVAVFITNIAVNVSSLYSQSAEAYSRQEELLQGNQALEILYVCVLGPIMEEVLCRGLILRTLRRSFSDRTVLWATALFFALIHGNLYQIFFTLPLGVLLGYLALRFDSALPGVFLHVAFNSCNYLVRLGDYIGLNENDALYAVLYYAVLALCLISIPLGILLIVLACKKNHRGFTLRRTMETVRSDFREAAGTPMRNVLFEEVDPSMPQPEYMIVGLGNPGEKYAVTRHNAGFMALDYLALRETARIDKLQFSALCGSITVNGKRVLCLKPQTFMNLSGQAVAQAARFYRIPPERILVIYDDVSFEPGQIRVRPSGSAGGHNGMKSIIDCLGTEAFPRIRIGVGAPPPDYDLMHWVLAALKGEDLDRVVGALESVYRAAIDVVSGEIDRAMNEYNGKRS